MAVGYVRAGTIKYANGSPIAIPIPTHSSGDLLVMCVACKSTSTSITCPGSWTEDTTNGEAAGGSGSQGNDTGPVRVKLMWREGTGDTTDVSLTVSTLNTLWAQVLVFSKGSGTWDLAAAQGIDTATGTPFETTMNRDPGITSGDYIAIAGGTPTDVAAGSQFSSPSMTATGATISTPTEVSEPYSALGSDIGGVVLYTDCSAGTASAAATVSMTAGGTTTNVAGPIVILRIREASASGSTYDKAGYGKENG